MVGGGLHEDEGFETVCSLSIKASKAANEPHGRHQGFSL